jgi:predicted phage tail protein
MVQYPFFYPKSIMHYILLIVFGILSGFLLIAAFLFFQKTVTETGTDKKIFMWLGLSFLLGGLSF